jgi:hypothetical protein
MCKSIADIVCFLSIKEGKNVQTTLYKSEAVSSLVKVSFPDRIGFGAAT